MDHPSKRRKVSTEERQPVVQYWGREPAVRRSRFDRRAGFASNPRIIDTRDSLLLRESEQEARKLAPRHDAWHRRQVEVPAVDVNVDLVVATVAVDVDPAGVTLAVDTPVLPPAVPPFPADLTVPAVPTVAPVQLPQVPPYPFVTLTPGGASTGNDTAAPGDSAPLPVSAAGLPPAAASAATPSPLPAAAVSSAIAAGSTLLLSPAPTAAPTATLPPLGASAASSLLPSGRGLSGSALDSITTTVSDALDSAVTGVPASTIRTFLVTQSDGEVFTSTALLPVEPGSQPTDAIAPGVGPNLTTMSDGSVATIGAASDSGSGSSSEPSTPQVVGGVVGGVAGFAVLLGLVLFLLRFLKTRHRDGALMLDETEHGDSQPPMSSGRDNTSFLPPAAAAFFTRSANSPRHSDVTASPTQERGFQRISGRKLPSAFSPGMTSEDASRHMQNLSETSFYRESGASYGEPSGPSALALAKEKETLMPSPARTPVIHHQSDDPFSDDNALGKLEPPLSPHRLNPRASKGTVGTLGRSHPSFDGSRGSKFTEDLV